MSENSDPSETDSLMQRVFFPYAVERRDAVASRKGRFVHYTSADTAMKIIRDQHVWMRNAVTMNDFSEVEHGLSCLEHAWVGEKIGESIIDLLEGLCPGACESAVSLFDQWQDDLRRNTFLTCLSEHLDSEDDHGRLSMWRAYGGRAGVALVLNLTPFMAVSDQLAAYSSPVAYLNSAQVAEQLKQVVENIRSHKDEICKLSPETVTGCIFTMLRFAALVQSTRDLEKSWNGE